MEIRQATQDDAAAMLRYLEDISRENCSTILQIGKLPSKEEEASWLRKKDGKSSVVFAALDGQQVVGMIEGNVGAHWQIKHNCELGMGVLKEHRRKGIGYKLLSALADWARSRNVARLELSVFSNNIAGIGLYEKYGFAIEGTKEKAIKLLEGGYANSILMAKTL